jgi:hypothetical protein
VADDLRRVTDSEVIKYSAAGFRDFTRIAASDPTMWRDVFLTTRTRRWRSSAASPRSSSRSSGRSGPATARICTPISPARARSGAASSRRGRTPTRRISAAAPPARPAVAIAAAVTDAERAAAADGAADGASVAEDGQAEGGSAPGEDGAPAAVAPAAPAAEDPASESATAADQGDPDAAPEARLAGQPTVEGPSAADDDPASGGVAAGAEVVPEANPVAVSDTVAEGPSVPADAAETDGAPTDEAAEVVAAEAPTARVPSPATRNAPEVSLLPLPRGGASSPDLASAEAASAPARTPSPATRNAPGASLRPLARGAVPAPAPVASAASAASGAAAALALAAAVPDAATTRPAAIARIGSGGAAAVSPRPAVRPDGLEQEIRAAAARLTPGRVAQPGVRGTLCGLPGLVGDRLEPITGRVSGCGIAEPVRLREVDGIPLTTPATINCDTARALQTWVRAGAGADRGPHRGGVANLRVVASYACRARNSQTGARLSEHARGNAIDIAGIGLADGSELTVLTDWNGAGAKGAFCGSFTSRPAALRDGAGAELRPVPPGPFPLRRGVLPLGQLLPLSERRTSRGARCGDRAELQPRRDPRTGCRPPPS